MPRFAAIPDAQGLLFVNQYTPDHDGFTQETIADRLKKAEATGTNSPAEA